MPCTFSPPQNLNASTNGCAPRPLPGRAARDFLRVFLSGASDELPDKQGRITIPPILRQYAGLTDNLVVIGSGTRAEIWDAAAWEEYLARTEAEFASLDEDPFSPLL